LTQHKKNSIKFAALPKKQTLLSKKKIQYYKKAKLMIFYNPIQAKRFKENNFLINSFKL